MSIRMKISRLLRVEWPRSRLTARVNPTIHGAMLRIGCPVDRGSSIVGLTLAVNLGGRARAPLSLSWCAWGAQKTCLLFSMRLDRLLAIVHTPS